MKEFVLIAAVIISYLMTVKEMGATVKNETENNIVDLNAIYKKYADRNGLDWRLLKAVAMVESAENPNAVNPADPSVGLFQILCVRGEDGYCTNKLYVQDWPPRYEELFDPDRNAFFGAQILAWNVNTYGLLKGIAVYNRWESRNEEPGEFTNQDYVNKVINNYVSLGGKV